MTEEEIQQRKAAFAKMKREHAMLAHKTGARADFFMMGLFCLTLPNLFLSFSWDSALLSYLTACNVMSGSLDSSRFDARQLPYWRQILTYTLRPDRMIAGYFEHKRLSKTIERYVPDHDFNSLGKRRTHDLYFVPLDELRMMLKEAQRRAAKESLSDSQN